ncbi:MAG: ATP-dependent acyl-CoA ligase [Burkholderiales bacterium]|nr:MAG: ATP-dependent acyl-CoA ligase [Burkholderiales bacterium]
MHFTKRRSRRSRVDRQAANMDSQKQGERARPRPERVVMELLAAQAHATPSGRFISCGASTMTFAGLEARANAIAAGLSAAGIGKGDRVAIVSTNRIEMVELFFAVARLGAIQVPLNVYLKGDFLAYQLLDSQACAIVVDGSGAMAVAPLLDRLAGLKLVVQLDKGPAPSVVPGVNVQPYAALALNATLPPIALRPSDLMSIVYTSGTTGQPKGCMLSHGYYARVGRVMGEAHEYRTDDLLITALPLFHGAARMMVLMAGLVHGLPVIVEPEFRAGTFLGRAAETGATVAVGIGAMGTALLATPPSPDDRAHKLRLMMMVPFPVDRQEAFQARFNIDPYAEAFGQTECVPATWNAISAERHRATCGLAGTDLQVALLDDDDLPVAQGVAGEICVRPLHPHAMFSGYWGKPGATAEAFRSVWYHTGDYGRADADGYIAFVDRKKDAVRRRGENVSTQEVEAAMGRFPGVAEVAVHAVPSEATDDEIKACLVVVPGAAISPQELFQYLKDRLPYFAMPRYVEIVPELPKNALSRVMKHELRKRPMTPAVWDFNALGLTVAWHERRAGADA